MDFKRGDILYRSTMADNAFYHEGVYIGNGKVVHVIMKKGQGIKVVKDPISKFSKNKPTKVKTVDSPFTKEEIAKRAESMIGKSWNYDRFLTNCESFTNWAALGIQNSYQGDLALHMGSAAAAQSFNQHKDFAGLISGFIAGILVSRVINKHLYS